MFPVKYEIIDNFLDKAIFTKLQNLVCNSPVIPWQYNPRIEGLDEDGEQKMMPNGQFDMSNVKSQNWQLSYLCHPIYADYYVQSEHFVDLLFPILNLLQVNALVRAKINLYPCQETLTEHGKHKDFPFSHKGAIFSLNTCDGYTKLDDDTKIESVENRMLLLDSSIPHASTNTSNANARYNININYF